MTPEELREAAHKLVERTTRQQQLPFHIEDEAVLATVARMLAEPAAEGGGGRAPAG